MPPPRRPAVRLSREGLTVRAVFWGTLMFIATGLAYMIVIGLLQR